MSGFFFYGVICLLSLINPLCAVIGLPDLISSTHSTITSFFSSSAYTWFQDNLAVLYWFFPKHALYTMIGATVVLLGLRVALAIWKAVKW